MIAADISDEEYAELEGYRSTSMKDILRSPAHYKYARANPKDSAVFRFGRAIHLSLLQPEEASRIKLIPDINKRTKDGKAEYAEFLDSLKPGDIPLTWKEIEDVEGMDGSVRGNFPEMFTNGQGEMTGQYHSTKYGMLKCRWDWIQNHDNGSCTIYDIKSCQDAQMFAFRRDAWKFKYHLSAAYYFDIATKLGMKPLNFVWIAVEKTAPYCCAAYECSEVSLSVGREMYQDALDTLRDCEDRDDWPGYDVDYKQLDLA